MSKLSASWGALIAAWLVVLSILGGGLVLALLQPSPPAGEPVVVALEISVDRSPEEPAPAAEATLAPPDSGPDSSPNPGPDLGPDDAPGTAVEGDRAQLAPSDATPKAPEETVAKPQSETQQVASSAPATLERAPDESEEPTSQAAQVVVTLPPPKPAVSSPGSPGTETPSEEHTADSNAKVEQPAAQAETDHPGSGDTISTNEQIVSIPVIPPAPEQLRYWERYRQPFNMDDPRPRIAVVLSGLGLSDSATEAAINKLPPAVTLSFSPYARDLERWIALARSRGHEVMLDLPMEPATFPNEDPGPQGLLTNLSAEENLNRLDWVLSRGSAYVGLAGSMGSRFTASRNAMEPILRDIQERGLIFLDRHTTENSVVQQVAGELGLPSVVNNRSVDERQASGVAIDARLAQIERIALTEGYAVAMAQPYPVTLERLADWATELTARGFVIAPISALADQQKRP